MRKLFYLYIILIGIVASSCSSSDEPESTPTRTLIMLYPWGGNTYSPFLRNISQMQTAMQSRGKMDDTNVMVWIANSKQTALLIKMRLKKGEVVCDTLKRYTDACPSGSNDYTTDDGLANVMADIKAIAPAEHYSLIIGSHGTGALTKGCDFETATAKQARAKALMQTRWWGATSSRPTYCIDVSTLAYALKYNDIYTDYLYFDACYMGSVEVAYTLRGVTHYLMASPAELLLSGSPFDTVGLQLLNNNYNGALDAFIDYFNSTTNPYGMMSLIDCTKLDNLAGIVKQIRATCDTEGVDVSHIQSFDGLSQHVFYDLSDYIQQLNPDASLLSLYNSAMSDAVPYKVNTASVISMYCDGIKINISTNCGLSTTDPTQNENVKQSQANTEWAIDTQP